MNDDFRDVLKLCSLDHLPDDADELELVFQLAYQVEQFQATGNPIYAINAFLCATDADLPVPDSIRAWQADYYREYRENEGAQPLDKLAKLSAGKGQSKAIKQYHRDRVNYYYMHMIWLLTSLYRIGISDAAYMLYERDCKKYDQLMLAGTMEDYYARGHWAERFSDDASDELARYTPARKSELLRSFPEHTIPTVMK